MYATVVKELVELDLLETILPIYRSVLNERSHMMLDALELSDCRLQRAQLVHVALLDQAARLLKPEFNRVHLEGIKDYTLRTASFSLHYVRILSRTWCLFTVSLIYTKVLILVHIHLFSYKSL